jgi:uncharacterized protein GlcG (DUF336 family)
MNRLLAFAKNIADCIEAEASRAQTPTAVCVIDSHGNVVLKHRMSGAQVFSIEISERKAYTSAPVGLRTADLSAAGAAQGLRVPVLMSASACAPVRRGYNRARPDGLLVTQTVTFECLA